MSRWRVPSVCRVLETHRYPPPLAVAYPSYDGDRCGSADGVQRFTPDEIAQLLNGPGLVWIDATYWEARSPIRLGKI